MAADPVRKAQSLVNAGDDVVGARLIAALSDEIIRLRALPSSKDAALQVALETAKHRLALAENVIGSLGNYLTLKLKQKN